MIKGNQNKQLGIIIFIMCVECGICQEAISNWSTGYATHYGVVGNAAVVPQLSCGFLEDESSSYAYFGSLSAYSNISYWHDQKGCGTCLEIKCGQTSQQSGTCLLAQQESIIITVRDLCGSDSLNNQCNKDGIILPAYVFQDLAAFQVGQLDIESRQVNCEADVNITLVIDQYLRGSANYMALKFQNVAGDASVHQVLIRQTPKFSSHDDIWLKMNRIGQAGFDFSGAPDPPMDIKLQNRDGQVIILSGIIQEETQVGEYDTTAQFQIDGVLDKMPQVVDFLSAQKGAIEVCLCFDRVPLGVPGFSCVYQQQHNRCYLDYMIQQNLCAKTCKRCSCQQTPSPIPTPDLEQVPLQENTSDFLQISFNDQFQQYQNQQLIFDENMVDPPLLAVELPKVSMPNANQNCSLSINGLLQSSMDLKMFYEALRISRIAELLEDPSLSLTILAPNNFAFGQFIQKTGIDWQDFKLKFPGLLQRIVLYMIMPGVWDTNQLRIGNHNQINPLQIITLLPSSSINVSISNDNSIEIFGPINKAKSKWVDLPICNSVVHNFNDVVVPFTDFTLQNLANFQQVTQLPNNLSEGFNNTIARNLNFTSNLNVGEIQQLIQSQYDTEEDISLLNNSEIAISSNIEETQQQLYYIPDTEVSRLVIVDDVNSNDNSTFVLMQQLISSQASNQIEEKAEIQDQQIYESDQTIIMSTPTMVYPYSIPTNAFEMNILYENQQHYQYQNLDFADLTQICPSVFQLIQRNQNLGVFEQLLVATEYDKILSQVSRKVTVFAPTDDAFLQFLQSQGTDLDSLIQDLAELRILMGYHIVNGLHNMDELRIFAMSPVVSNKLTTYLQNEQFVMELEVMQNSEGSVYIKAVGSNGTLDREMRSCESVVHLIDQVLLPSVYSRPSNEQSFDSHAYESPSPAPTITLSQSVVPQKACSNMEAFFGARGAAWADLRYFKILMDVTHLSQTLYNTRSKVNMFVPTNVGFSLGLKVVNATFNELLMDVNASDAIVRYHVVNGEQQIEGFAKQAQTQRIQIPTALDGQDILFQPDDFTQNGQLGGVTSYITRANILEFAETCQGRIYILDELLLPQDFKLK